jgi:tRNA threonylcarbamoyladenosine biosynthesis protein TsaB
VNPRLLAFDTSTEALAVALQSPGGLHAWCGPGGAAASAGLIPRIETLLAGAGMHFADLQAIAFGRGPGAFTGLRTSCAVAQGLAEGLGLPVLAIDSLLVVAEDARAQLGGDAAGALQVQVAMDARMGEVYAGAYAFDGMRWHCTAPPSLRSPDELNADWAHAPPRCMAGSALGVFGARLHTGRAQCVAQEVQRAAALMRLAQQAWRDGAGVDPADALPLYLRDKVALTVAERQAARVAAT